VSPGSLKAFDQARIAARSVRSEELSAQRKEEAKARARFWGPQKYFEAALCASFLLGAGAVAASTISRAHLGQAQVSAALAQIDSPFFTPSALSKALADIESWLAPAHIELAQ